MNAVEDIGKFILYAFENHEKMNGIALDIAGDQHTMPETAEILGRAMGRKIEFVRQPIEEVRNRAKILRSCWNGLTVSVTMPISVRWKKIMCQADKASGVGGAGGLGIEIRSDRSPGVFTSHFFLLIWIPAQRTAGMTAFIHTIPRITIKENKTSFARASTHHFVECHQIGELGKADGDQALLRTVKRALRVEDIQIARYAFS